MIFLPSLELLSLLFSVFLVSLSRTFHRLFLLPTLSDVKMIIVWEFFAERDFAVIKELKINCFVNNINL